MARTKKRTDGRYAKQVYIGKDDAGKRKYKTFYATTQKEADRLAAEYRAALGRGLDPNAGKQTVKTLLDNFLAAKKAKGVGASWYTSLNIYVKHLKPLHSILADKVRTADIQRVLNNLAETGLSHTTLTHIASTAKAAFALAIPEIIQYNPCDRVIVPAGRPAKTRGWLDDEQQAWVRETPHRAQRAAMLMMYSGLRRGEVTALTWGDIDLDERTISVNKAWDFSADKIKLPKTAAGIRIVHIPQLLADYLREERKSDPSTMYVVHTAHGGRMTAQAWKRLWNSYMAYLNAKYAFDGANVFAVRQKDENGKERGALPILIKTFTAHELRHTFCTLLYKAGVDVLTAKDQMGHADIKVTMGIYTHLDAKYKAAKMDALDMYLENACKSNASQAT